MNSDEWRETVEKLNELLGGGIRASKWTPRWPEQPGVENLKLTKGNASVAVGVSSDLLKSIVAGTTPITFILPKEWNQ